MASPSFRPYLSASELHTILTALKSHNISAHLKLIRKLELFSYKISQELVSPSHIPVPTIQEKLGFVQTENDGTTISPAKYRYSCYLKWAASPPSCSSIEIEKAMEYRFENDMMNEEEESTYLFSISKSTQG